MNAGARTWARMSGCMRCCWAGLLCCRGTTLCRGSGALGIGGAIVCAKTLNRVGRTMYNCVHLCTQGALGRTGSATPTARPTGFVVDVEDQDFRGHRRARSTRLKTGNCVGSGGAGQTKRHICFNTSSFIGHGKCLLLGCLWAQHLCYF